jgi:hypothetical protein
MAFHAHDGWFFRRNDDGSVTIAQIPPPHPDGDALDAAFDNASTRVTFNANTWASIIASVSAKGEDNYRFYLARIFHAGTGKRCAHILGEGFAGSGRACGLYFDTHYMLDHDHRFAE